MKSPQTGGSGKSKGSVMNDEGFPSRAVAHLSLGIPMGGGCLGEARAAARNAGFQGAMFPAQSVSDGQEETQELNLNLHSQRWVPDILYLQPYDLSGSKIQKHMGTLSFPGGLKMVRSVAEL